MGLLEGQLLALESQLPHLHIEFDLIIALVGELDDRVQDVREDGSHLGLTQFDLGSQLGVTDIN